MSCEVAGYSSTQMKRRRRQDGLDVKPTTRDHVTLPVGEPMRRFIEELAELQAQQDRIAATARHLRQELDATIGRNLNNKN